MVSKVMILTLKISAAQIRVEAEAEFGNTERPK